jgi:lambda family phage tail tape measure protein
MADNTVNIKLQLTALGIKEANSDAVALSSNLDKAVKTADVIKKTAAASGTGESKTARSLGIGAGTGSAASDFAAQASGLGGLVHLYATFAANLFAVSAGFTMLSKAMDTTNLVAGLDQIGASVGKNLGSLSKQMVDIANGAISLQQAMRSTAMATSGGMTNDQILRMTKVAQQASLALGRDLPDSMDRLTKGIIKTQPELLDELGIMTRVIPAQSAYAEKIGKTVTSLTTFEKQQAFANAVLEEGEKKFGAIALQSNPYSKILAGLTNLAQTGLSLVNTVLAPLVAMLASSPTGLAIAIGAVASMLLKQAIPTMGMLKENTLAAAEQSKLLAVTKSIEAQKGYQAEALAAKAAAVEISNTKLAALKESEDAAKTAATNNIATAKANSALVIANAKKEFEISKQTADNLAEEKVSALVRVETKIKELSDKELAKGGKPSAAYKLLNTPDINSVTQEQLNRVESTAKGYDTKAVKANLAGNEELYQSNKKNAAMQREYISTILDVQKAHNSYTGSLTEGTAKVAAVELKASTAVQNAISAESEAHKNSAIVVAEASVKKVLAENAATLAAEEYVKTSLQNESILSTGRHTRMIADRALLQAASDSIVSQSSQTASTKGFTAAMSEAYKSVTIAMSGASSEMVKIGTTTDESGKQIDNFEKVTTPAMGKVRGGWTLLKSAVVSATSVVTTALSAFQSIFIYVGIAIAIYQTFNSVLSSSAKESAAFNDSLETLKSSFDNIDRTIDVISKKDPLGSMSIVSTQALANAFNDLTTNLDATISRFEKLVVARSGWDSAKNWLFDMFGQGDADKLAASVSMSIVDAMKVMEEGPAKEAVKSSLTNLIGKGIDPSNFNSINSAIKDLDENKILGVANATDKLLQTANRNANNAASALTAFATALADIAKQNTVMGNKLIPTDDYSKLGIELGKGAVSLNEALKDPINSLKALAALSKDISTLSLLPRDTAVELGGASKQIDAILSSLGNLDRQKASLEASISKTQATLEAGTSRTDYGVRLVSDRDLEIAQKIHDIDASRLVAIDVSISKQKAAAEDMRTKFKDIGTEFATASFNNLAKGFKIALQEASITSAKGYLDVMKQAGMGVAAAKTEAGINQAEFAVQRAAIEANLSVIQSQNSLKLSIDLLRLVNERTNLYAERDALKAQGIPTRGVDTKIEANVVALTQMSTRISKSNIDPKLLAKDAASKTPSADTLELMKTIPGYMSELMGAMGQLAKIDAAAGASSFASKQKIFVASIDSMKEAETLNITALTTDKEKLAYTEKLSSTYDANLSSLILTTDQDILRRNYAKDLLEYAKQQSAIDKSGSKAPEAAKKAQVELDRARSERLRKFNTDDQVLSSEALNKKEAGENALAKVKSDYALKDKQASTDLFKAQNDGQQQALKYLDDSGLLSAKEYAKRVEILALSVAEAQYAQETANINKKDSDSRRDAEEALRVLKRENAMPGAVQRDTTPATDALKQLNVDTTNALALSAQVYDNTVQGIKNTAEAVAKSSDWITGAQKGLQSYAKTAADVAGNTNTAFTNAFKGMEDALVSFVTTGKLDFNSLANSIIADMVRIAVQQSVTGPLANAGMSFISSMFSSGSSGSSIPAGTFPSAKGNAFGSTGVQAFAKGSGFSNSIVSNPTLFKFASGTGLMGEAGPEAIMPLTRDATGTLGVRSAGINQSNGNNVVINIIESKEKAGTQERDNKNGVDMISIFVEKVKSSLAGDITSGNGSVPNALSRTYGLNRSVGAY